jgi:hypothetical protein
MRSRVIRGYNGETRKAEFRCQNKVMCGDQEMWSKAEYNKMIWNRVEHIGNIKDVAKCRSGGSRDLSHVIGAPEVESIA